MASRRALSSLKASQLKQAAFLIGLPTTGTKPELERLIRHRISGPLAFPEPPKIVSVDMGIKNLGICVLEAPHLANKGKPSNTITSNDNGNSPLKVLSWKKLDVLSLLKSQENGPNSPATETDLLDSTKSRRQRAVSATAFQPSVLSKTALIIAQDLLYSHKPSHILIERQRFRSGGASAVQEWTLRVNMLESMLWASLETMRHEQNQNRANPAFNLFPAVHEVSPARVAKFWCTDPSTVGTKVPVDLFEEGWRADATFDGMVSRVTKKIEKKDKIAVVRSWLSQHGGGESKAPSVVLECTEETRLVASTFQSEINRGRKQHGDGVAAGKLDDLADCLLQCVAWVRWEENRRRIRDLLAPPTT